MGWPMRRLVVRHTLIGEWRGWGKAKRAPAAIEWGGFATLEPPATGRARPGRYPMLSHNRSSSIRRWTTAGDTSNASAR